MAKMKQLLGNSLALLTQQDARDQKLSNLTRFSPPLQLTNNHYAAHYTRHFSHSLLKQRAHFLSPGFIGGGNAVDGGNGLGANDGFSGNGNQFAGAGNGFSGGNGFDSAAGGNGNGNVGNFGRGSGGGLRGNGNGGGIGGGNRNRNNNNNNGGALSSYGAPGK